MSASLKESGQRPATDLPLDEGAMHLRRDQEFVKLLNAAGLACELDANQLAGITSTLSEARIDSRRMDILESYYIGTQEPSVSERRRGSDRFFIHHDEARVNAHQLVALLSQMSPEIAPISLQRIGTDDGPLVLRAGEHFSAISDDDDEGAEDGTVAVRALVRALNTLLARASVAERLVPLIPDENRELYVGVTEEGAMTLLQGGCTELGAVASLREFASW